MIFNYRKFIRHYPLLLVAFLAVLALYVANFIFNLDLFHKIVISLDNLTYLKTEEVIFSAVLLGCAFIGDHFRSVRRNKRKQALEADRLDIARRTLATVHDIVNNSLNNLLLIKIEAEKGLPLSTETLALFGDMIDGMAAELRNLDEIKVISKRDLSRGLSVLDIGIRSRGAVKSG